MKLRQFALLTDENVDPEVVAGLRQLGFDVLDVIESGRAGASDIDLLRYATSQGRIVVSHDADFGTLAVRRMSRWSDWYSSDPAISTPGSRWERSRRCCRPTST